MTDHIFAAARTVVAVAAATAAVALVWLGAFCLIWWALRSHQPMPR